MQRVAVWALALVAPVALAQESATPWSGEAEVGVLVSNGNTDSTDVNSRLSGKYEVTDWRNVASLRSLYSETEGETTAEKYVAEGESNYKFSERQFWFLRGSYTDDRFSGYDFQSSVSTGYGNRVWSRGDRSFLEFKAGTGYRYDRLERPNPKGKQKEDGAIVRLAGTLNVALSENALFIQELSSELGVDDGSTISESLTALQANIAGNLSMKASYRVRHQSDVPMGSANTDTEAALTLLYGF